MNKQLKNMTHLIPLPDIPIPLHNIIYHLESFYFVMDGVPLKEMSSYSVGCVDFTVSGNNIINFLKYFDSYLSWKKADIEAPYATEASLKIVEELNDNLKKRYNIYENKKLSFHSGQTFVNPATGWVCIGDPAKKSDIAVKFLQNAIAVLENAQLAALWIKPKWLL